MKKLVSPQFIFQVTLIAIIIANFYFFKNVVFGVLAGSIYTLYYGAAIGQQFFKGFERAIQVILGVIMVVGGIVGFYWLSFYINGIGTLTFITAIFLPPLIAASFKEINIHISVPTFPKIRSYLGGLYIVLYAVHWFLLIANQSFEAIHSPWDALPSIFFVNFFVMTAILIFYILRTQKAHTLILVVLHFFAASSVAAVIYILGYGFDPFLHLAGQKVILATTTLTPKPLYYIGEYSLLIFIHHITFISLEWLNRYALPIAFSLFLPLSAYIGLVKGLKWDISRSLVSILAILALPFSFFITTTPQGFTNLFILMIIFLSFARKELPRWVLWALGIVTTIFHPMYGIPALLFIAYLYFRDHPKTFHGGQIFSLVISLFIFPILFLINSWVNHHGISLDFKKPHFESLFTFTSQYNFVYDFLYAYAFNVEVWFGLAIIAGIVLAVFLKKLKTFIPYIFFGFVYTFNYIFTKYALELDFTTDINAGQFLERIEMLAFYFFLPMVLYALYVFISKLREHKKAYLETAFITLALSIFITASLYISYPVFDTYANSKAFNVSSTDISTVRIIENRATNDYIVLANQMVGAAAIKEFGFAHYYNDEFYYSIPNGNESGLYTYFKSMIFDDPSRETALKAMDVAGVNTLYFVVNDYWKESEEVSIRAEEEADEVIPVNGGGNYIFIFKRL